MLTREVSGTGKFTQLGLFSLCSAASTMPHIYSARQTSFALTPGPHLPDVAGHCRIGSYLLETVGTTRTFPWHIPAETCCYRCSASTAAARHKPPFLPHTLFLFMFTKVLPPFQAMTRRSPLLPPKWVP